MQFRKLIYAISISLICYNGYSQCGTPTVHQLTHTSPGEWYRGSTVSWMPGDTLKFMESNYSVIEIFGGGGTPDCPIIVVANTNFNADVIRFKGGAHYYKLLSTGAGKDTTTVRSIKAKTISLDMADHITVEGPEISGGDVGFYNKMNVSYDVVASWYPNYPQTGNKIIGAWIHDIGFEGCYVGLTLENGYTVVSSWSGLDTVIVGNRVDSSVIRNCYINRVGWDLGQIAHAGYGNEISGNIGRDFGLLDDNGQSAGFIMGGDSNGDVFNNDIKRGTGNGIEVFGFGSINVYGNIIDSVGNTTRHPNGEESLYVVYHTVTYISRPPLALYVHDNKINHPKLRGAIRNSTNGNEIGSLIRNNTFCIPNAASNWQSQYLILDVPGTTNENNTLLCESGCRCYLIGAGKFINSN